MKKKDDYEWQNYYPVGYAQEQINNERRGEHNILKYYKISEGKLDYLNIHFNPRFIYNCAIKYQPKSIFEVGFGWGSHLINLRNFLPDAEIAGCDISYKQYENACGKYNLDKYGFDLKVCDFTLFPENKTYDMVYSQAVVMHMSDQRAIQAIRKMGRISNKIIVFTDAGIANFMEELKKIGKVSFNEDMPNHKDHILVEKYNNV